MPPITPLSAPPGYIPPVSTRNRAYVQQPTYITQNQTPTAVNPVYSSKPLQEEVCVECAMRDQDMADVDVTSPGVWERESDAHYEDLKAREAEEAATGIINTDDPPRPRATGGRLSEQNLKIWLSIVRRMHTFFHTHRLTEIPRIHASQRLVKSRCPIMCPPSASSSKPKCLPMRRRCRRRNSSTTACVMHTLHSGALPTTQALLLRRQTIQEAFAFARRALLLPPSTTATTREMSPCLRMG